MTNHIHLVVIPSDPDGLDNAVGRTHREPDDERIVEGLRWATRAGRPLVSDSVIAKPETRVGRRLRPMPRGRPRKET